MRALRSLTFALILASAGLPALAQEPISNLPRNQTLIVENPEGTIKNAGWFNIWAINAGGQSTGLHQLAMDTFWYIDPQRGLDGVWMNSLASDKPIGLSGQLSRPARDGRDLLPAARGALYQVLRRA